MIEFHQGSSILTLWSQNSEIIPHSEEFLFYVGNTHTIGKISDESIPPMIIQSSFNRMPYFSITSQIFDIEARGFLRVITLIVAHNSIKPSINRTLINIMNNFQKISLTRFLDELPGYYLAVKHIFNEMNDKDVKKPVIYDILHEIEPILNQYKIQIDNYSRDLNVTLDKDQYFDSLVDAINLLPSIHNFPISASNIQIDFGLSCISQSKLFDYITSTSSQNKSFNDYIQKISQSNIFGHLIFTILSGHQLVIVSQQVDLSIQLTELLLNFVPLLSPAKLQYIDQYDQYDQSAKIIICKDNLIEDLNEISVLNLDDKTYEGFICGSNSFVWQVIKSANVQKFGTFLSMSYNKLKNYSDHFVEQIQVFSKSEFQNSHQYISFLQSNNFQIDDLPIFSYWLSLIPSFKNVQSILSPMNWSESFGIIWLKS